MSKTSVHFDAGGGFQLLRRGGLPLGSATKARSETVTLSVASPLVSVSVGEGPFMRISLRSAYGPVDTAVNGAIRR